MGSIEVFPARRTTANLTDVSRGSTVPGTGVVRVRPARLEDYAAVRAVQRGCAPHLPPLSLRQFESRLATFPEGQLVAACDGDIVGSAGALVLRWEAHGPGEPWRELTGDGWFTTHQPAGDTLYAEAPQFDPGRHGAAAGRALLQARRRLCRRLNLKRILATARLPGYAALRESLSPELYAMKVIWGEIPDPALRLALAQGFQYCGVVHGFRPEDEESAGHAALLAWLNPLHAPPTPPASAQFQRARKCA